MLLNEIETKRRTQNRSNTKEKIDIRRYCRAEDIDGSNKTPGEIDSRNVTFSRRMLSKKLVLHVSSEIHACYHSVADFIHTYLGVTTIFDNYTPDSRRSEPFMRWRPACDSSIY